MSLTERLFPGRPSRDDAPAGFTHWVADPVEPPGHEFDGSDEEYAQALAALASVAEPRPARARRRTP